MCDEKHEQLINMKFLVKLKKSPTECYKLLKEAYGENSLSRARVFEWYKRFSEGRESTEDDQRPGRPVSVSTSQTVTKINEIVRGDRRMSILMIAEIVNADKETVRKILHDELNMKKVCAKLVPKNLAPDQKLVRQQICSDFLERLDEEPELNPISEDQVCFKRNPVRVDGRSEAKIGGAPKCSYKRRLPALL